nr:MAG TPA: hypothetical protein [Caudoviricetes sp.]
MLVVLIPFISSVSIKLLSFLVISVTVIGLSSKT